MSKFEKILTQIFKTKLGLFVVSLLLAFGFGVLADKLGWFWADVAMYICLVYPAGLLLVMIVYAVIINPIKNHKNYKEFKKFRDGK